MKLGSLGRQVVDIRLLLPTPLSVRCPSLVLGLQSRLQRQSASAGLVPGSILSTQRRYYLPFLDL